MKAISNLRNVRSEKRMIMLSPSKDFVLNSDIIKKRYIKIIKTEKKDRQNRLFPQPREIHIEERKNIDE